MTEKTQATSASQAATTPAQGVAPAGENITGRGVFVIETVPVGVSVRTAFLAEDGRLLDIPAVFPDMMYAMAQIDELKQLVAQRFAEAAQIGNQVIAQQIEANRARAADTVGVAATTSGAVAGVTGDAADVQGETKPSTRTLSRSSAKDKDSLQ